MSDKKQRVALAWGGLIRHRAEKLDGGSFPAYTVRHVYVPLRFFGRLVEVQDALSRALPDHDVMPYLSQGPPYIKVINPPRWKDLPDFVEIDH